MSNRRRMGVLALGATLALLALLALGGCLGMPSAQTVHDILTQAQAAAPRDASFSLALSITTPVSGSSTPATITERGTGILTTQPYRQDITLTTSADGVTIPLELLTDGQTLYTRATGSTTWRQQPADATTRFLEENLSAPTLIGSETLGGVAAWHLRGTLSASDPQNTEDLWLRKDNYLPLKSILHAASGDGTAITATLTFSKWNTGAKITPPAKTAIQLES
jgi:hypothetical protein